MNDQVVMSMVHHANLVVASFRKTVQEILQSSDTSQTRIGQTALGLCHFAGERSQTATLIIQYGRLWDAEIILRSATECVVKLLFICLADPAERERRLDEYQEGMSVTHDLRQSERARQRLSTISSDSTVRDIFEAMVIPQQIEDELRKRWPRKNRKSIDTKWSFSEIVFWIEEFSSARTHARVLLHNYGIASHFVHADERAILLTIDRRDRPDDVREKMENAHAARLLSDIVMLYALMAIGAVELSKLRRDTDMYESFNQFKRFLDEIDKVQSLFYETQVDLYDRIRNM